MANINKIKVGYRDADSIMFDSYKTTPEDYKYNFRNWSANPDAPGNTIEVTNNKIIIRRFKPNMWIMKSPAFASKEALCAASANTAIHINGMADNATLFSTQYYHHSVVAASGGTQGYIRGVGLFPFSNDINGWQLTSYGQYARHRGELPFTAYVWDNLTYSNGTKMQIGSETTALRGDGGVGYNAYGKTLDGLNRLVIPDWTTFDTPYSTLYMTIGLYTGLGISFDAWECENRINALKMTISTRNEGGVGSTRNAYTYSGFGTIRIRVTGMSTDDRLEYGSGIVAESTSSITTDGEYSITYGEGKGLILYGDTTNTSPVTIELIENDYLDEDGYVNIPKNPITITLPVVNGIDITNVECWDAYCRDIQIWHKDKTLENCWMKHRLCFPNSYNLFDSAFTKNANIEWLTATKFRVTNNPPDGTLTQTSAMSNTAVYWSISSPGLSVRITGGTGATVFFRRRLEGTTSTDELTQLKSGLNEIPAYKNVVYATSPTSPMKYYEAQFEILGTISSPLIVELIPEYAEDDLLKLYGPAWSLVGTNLKIPEIVDLEDHMSRIKFQARPANKEFWDRVKTWYENNVGVNNNFRTGNVFLNSNLDEIVIKLPDDSYQFGEDNFAGSDIERIKFVQSTKNSHFSAPQRLLRSANNLKEISIEWADDTAQNNYLCGANTIVDGMSASGYITYPERFINWAANRSNVLVSTIPSTLFQYAFNYADHLVTIPAYPGTEDENTIIPADNMVNSFRGCTELTYVGPILDMCLVQPANAVNVFYGCNNLSYIRIKNLNHGSWNFDGVSRNGVLHGSLPSLDDESIEYLFENLTDLNLYEPSKHVDTIDKSFKNWDSAYKTSIDETPDWDYALTNIRQFTCRKRYQAIADAPFIASTTAALSNMSVYVEGLISGEYLLFVVENGAIINEWNVDGGTQYVSKTAGVVAGFKLIGGVDVISPVTITIYNGLDLTNPRVSTANLYCPEEWDASITPLMLGEANNKGWNVFIGGEPRIIV